MNWIIKSVSRIACPEKKVPAKPEIELNKINNAQAAAVSLLVAQPLSINKGDKCQQL